MHSRKFVFGLGVGIGAGIGALFATWYWRSKMEGNAEQIVLDEIKNELLANFQAATGEEDTGRSIAILESRQWNLRVKCVNSSSFNGEGSSRRPPNSFCCL